MSNKYLDKDVDYNISAEETGAGKFNRDKGVPISEWDPESTSSVEAQALDKELKANYVTVEDVSGAFPPAEPKSNRFYRDDSALYWYDDLADYWLDLSMLDDPYAIEELTSGAEQYINMTTQAFKGAVATYSDLPAIADIGVGSLFNVEDVKTVYRSTTSSWVATTIPYVEIKSDHFYAKRGTDDVFYWMPNGHKWYSIFNGTGTGEPNVIETISVNGSALPVSNKDVDVTSLSNTIESISVNGVAQIVDENKNVDLDVAGEMNKIDEIYVNGSPIPIVDKIATFVYNDLAEENVIDVIKYNGTTMPVEDKVCYISGAGEENLINSISSGGIPLPIDENKNVNIDITAGITVGRGLAKDNYGVVGHKAENAIYPQTAEAFQKVQVDEYGHVLKYTMYTLGNGISMTNNILGHANSVSTEAAQKLRLFSYDSQGHITASAPVGVVDTLVDTDDIPTSAAVYDVVGDIAEILARLNDGSGI